MKKLMTAVVVCALAGLAPAQNGAESANVVGYTTKDLVANQKAISGAQFVEVGDVELDLASIKLVNVVAEGGASIQWWNGSAYESAVWVGLDWDENNPGWGNEATEAVNHTFAAGEGFWIVLPGDVTGVPQVTQAGEVTLSKATSYSFDLEANKKSLVINPLPTTLALSDIKLVNVVAEGGASIQWWNGSVYESAVWVGLDWDENNPGWGNEATEEVNHTFAVSTGFWIVLPGDVTGLPQVKIANKVVVL